MQSQLLEHTNTSIQNQSNKKKETFYKLQENKVTFYNQTLFYIHICNMMILYTLSPILFGFKILLGSKTFLIASKSLK